MDASNLPNTVDPSKPTECNSLIVKFNTHTFEVSESLRMKAGQVNSGCFDALKLGAIPLPCSTKHYTVDPRTKQSVPVNFKGGPTIF